VAGLWQHLGSPAVIFVSEKGRKMERARRQKEPEDG
jgi:hypothetical protein